MRLVVVYLLAFLSVLGVMWSFELRGILPTWIASLGVAYDCILIGGLGGCVYCLRAVYLNRSVNDRWQDRWIAWYLIRPLVSCLVGGVAFLFLKAGLLVLDASQDTNSNSLGFLALSFIAGLNVDRFLVRIEGIAESTWGLRPSRISESSEE